MRCRSTRRRRRSIAPPPSRRAGRRDEMELENRVAIVTGAARNIGRAIALDLAAAGAAVVINAKTAQADVESVVAAIEAKGGRALPILADVADEAAVARMVAVAAEHFGRIDILVNNAAVRREAPIDALDFAAWRESTGSILH